MIIDLFLFLNNTSTVLLEDHSFTGFDRIDIVFGMRLGVMWRV